MPSEETQKIRDAAFRALRSAGLKHDDPDLVGLFDTSQIKILNGRAVVPPSFTATAYKSKSNLFIDALTLSASEFQAVVSEMDRRHRAERLAASERRGSPDDAQFDAMKLSKEEWAAHLKTLR